jgi:lysine 6-dehydrogenase
MKVLVLGASGMQGRAASFDLVHNERIEEVILAGIDLYPLEKTGRWLNSEKCRVEVVDVATKFDTFKLIERVKPHVVVCSVPWKYTLTPLEASIEAGVDFVDFGLYQNVAFDNRLPMYHQRATAAKMTIVPSCGLAPGMTNMLAAYGISHMDTGERVEVYVGGIPEKPEPPLQYKAVWSIEGVWTQFMEDCRVIHEGKPTTVEATTGKVDLHFEGLGDFEAAYTDGLGTLLHAYKEPEMKGVQEVYEKTIRWPGHYEKIRTFKECGLLGTEPIEVDGCSVSPRAFLTKLLEPALKMGEKERDMSLLRVNTFGKKDGQDIKKSYEMVDYRDNRTGILSMARTTGFTGAIIVDMIASGKITDKGVVMPEKLGANQAVFAEMIEEYRRRDIHIRELI